MTQKELAERRLPANGAVQIGDEQLLDNLADVCCDAAEDVRIGVRWNIALTVAIWLGALVNMILLTWRK